MYRDFGIPVASSTVRFSPRTIVPVSSTVDCAYSVSLCMKILSIRGVSTVRRHSDIIKLKLTHTPTAVG
jgi:hypothetical protein